MSEIRIVGVNNRAFPIEANFVKTIKHSITKEWTCITMINDREYYTAEPLEEVQARIKQAQDVSREQPKKQKKPEKAKIIKTENYRRYGNG
jgi:uncharacterized protein YlzI (FlbEa/FlbD family)